MAERLVQHKHCPVCKKAMSTDRETCSEDCAIRHRAQVKERKRTMYFFYFSMVVLVMVLAIQFLGI